MITRASQLREFSLLFTCMLQVSQEHSKTDYSIVFLECAVVVDVVQFCLRRRAACRAACGMPWFKPEQAAVHLHMVLNTCAVHLHNSEFMAVSYEPRELLDMFCSAHLN